MRLAMTDIVRTKIRRLLDERGWTQARLSIEAGLKETTVKDLLRRNHSPRLDTLIAIAAALKVDVATLVSESVDLTEEEAAALQIYRSVGRDKADQLLTYMHFLLETARKSETEGGQQG